MDQIKCFRLFRIRLPENPQVVIGHVQIERRDALDKVLQEEKPVINKHGRWTIGSVEHIDNDARHFQIGRITRERRHDWDEEEREFIIRDDEDAPFTQAILDVRLQVCAIAEDKHVATNVATIGRRLQDMLRRSETMKAAGYLPEVNEMPNPQGLIEQIRSSARVETLWLGFGPTNSFDADEMFIKPLSKTADEVQAEKGLVTYYGGNTGQGLDKDAAEQLVKASTSEGKVASARLRATNESKTKTVKSSDTPAVVQVEDVGTDSFALRAAVAVRTLYRKIHDLVGF